MLPTIKFSGCVDVPLCLRLYTNISSKFNKFNLDVSGNNYRAYISGASGDLNEKDNHIDLDYKQGTWMLGPKGSEISAGYGDAKGSVYGPNGEAVGGVWNMGNSGSDYHATGIFEGTK